MWDFNRISNEVLIVVVNYGVIEDVLAKERISKRFGVLVSSVVSKRRKFTTDCDPDCDPQWTGTMWPRPPLTMNDVMTVLKRMPMLTSLSGFGIENWDLIQTQQLAIVNRNIVCFHPVCNHDHQKVLKYIEHVKELHPNYKGSRVMCTFDPNGADYRALVERFPDLKLKLDVYGTMAKKLKPKTIGAITFSVKKDKLPHKVIFPNVKNVLLTSNYKSWGDLASLPNLENITKYSSEPSSVSLRLSGLYPTLIPNLRFLTLDMTKEWSADDTLPLKAIIRKVPLKRLQIKFPQNFPTREVLQFVIDSPIRTLKELIIPHLEIEKDGKGRTKMSVNVAEALHDMEQLAGLIRKFKKVDQVRISLFTTSHQPLDVECIKESFRQKDLDLLMIPGF